MTNLANVSSFLADRTLVAVELLAYLSFVVCLSVRL